MIEFQNTSVEFYQNKKKFRAIRDVTFTIQKGEIFGIAGSSGAGKSTLLRTINGLQKPSSGEVIVNGKSIGTLKDRELRKIRADIGMIFQHFNLIKSKNVYKNIEFVLLENGKTKKEAEKKIRELLKFVGIEDKIYAYPAQLSGGQQQRVAIARALANDAQILLCDEPTSALDIETTSQVLNLLEKVNKELGVTIVIITHELDVIKKICDRVALMDQGRVKELGEVYPVFTEPSEDFTKDFLKKTQTFEIPEKLRNQLSGTLVKVSYFNDNADHSLISDSITRFQVKINIIHGKIEYLKDRPLGILYLDIDGEPETVKQAIDYLNSEAGKVEVIGREDSYAG